MTRATTYSWILLAIELASGKSPAPLERIIAAADALNHAIPTQKEMQESIGWLIQKGFISEEDKEYNLAEQGKDLLIEIYLQAPKLFNAWDLLKRRFFMSRVPRKTANISQIEWQTALETYYKRAKLTR
jgi:hypothetical protein